MFMNISNNNNLSIPRLYPNISNLAATPVRATPVRAAPTALNAPIISRIFNAKPGCGSCGRK